MLLEQFRAYIEEQRAEMRTAFEHGRLVTPRHNDSRGPLETVGSSQTCMDLLAHSVQGSCSQVGTCVGWVRARDRESECSHAACFRCPSLHDATDDPRGRWALFSSRGFPSSCEIYCSATRPHRPPRWPTSCACGSLRSTLCRTSCVGRVTSGCCPTFSTMILSAYRPRPRVPRRLPRQLLCQLLRWLLRRLLRWLLRRLLRRLLRQPLIGLHQPPRQPRCRRSLPTATDATLPEQVPSLAFRLRPLFYSAIFSCCLHR